MPKVMRAGELLSRYPAEIQSIARELRMVILEAMPFATESVKLGWGALTYRHPDAGYVCGIFPFKDHIKLIFEKGVMLEDPDRLFAENSKKLKQVRFVEFFRTGDVARKKKPLMNLIQIAVAHH